MQFERIVQRLLVAMLAISMALANTSNAYAAPPIGQHIKASGFRLPIISARFVSPYTLDSTLPGVGTNRYSYADNDPINKSNPNGHWFGAIGAAIGAIADYFGSTKPGNTPADSPDAQHMSDAESLGNAAAATAATTGGVGLLSKMWSLFGKKQETAKQISATSQQASQTQTWSDQVQGQTRGKVPDEWGTPNPTKKGSGLRWSDPLNKGNGVRIDEGSPNSANPSQQADHVVVNSGGKVIGRNGQPIQGSIQDDAVNAHIPYKNCLGWREWSKP